MLRVRKVPGKTVAREMLPVSISSFEISPYDFVNKLLLITASTSCPDLTGLKYIQNCKIDVRRCHRVLEMSILKLCKTATVFFSQ